MNQSDNAVTEVLDFRSDTVTKPTAEMRAAMAAAEVGDDVYGDDPTVNALQDYAADLMGTEAALFVCSGTMGNLIAVMSHCNRGEGVLMGAGSHIWKNECGNVASVAGVMPFPLDDAAGVPTVSSVRTSYLPLGNVHFAHTTLLIMENTHNSTGGIPIDVPAFASVADEAHNLGLGVHVDGARIFDAAGYFGVDAKAYASRADSIQFCLSKGLAAPMGSLLCGRLDFIERARRFRKALGGGQRQSGIAAAAGLVALRDMRGRLVDDHRNAALLADLLQASGIAVEQVSARTNMVYFASPHDMSAAAFAKKCGEHGLLVSPAAEKRIRMVTHWGLDAQSVRSAVTIINEIKN